MLSIALIHSGKSFMPEIEAYQHHFENMGIRADALINPSQINLEPYDVLWFFMGFQHRLNEVNKNKIIIHEYCSASTPPLARIKDLVKKIINPKPDLRISLTTEHRGRVYSIDNIPEIIRRQGVHTCFFEKIAHTKKEYDFIYTGSALKIRKTDKWLQAFITEFPASNILLVGNHETQITEKFQSYSNIQFKTQVPITALPDLLARARFAVNYVPDVYPFNTQPSTKLLEYSAAGCKIISNRYEWVNKFEALTGAAFFLIKERFSNLSNKELNQFKFTTPDMSRYRWETIFEEMKIDRFLSNY